MSRSGLALIACDWNGTFVDDALRGLSATNAVLHRFGLATLSMNQFRASFRLPLNEYFSRLGVATSNVDGAIGHWNDELGLQSSRLRRGAQTLFETAKEFEADVGIVSAASEDVVVRDAKALGVFSQLSFIQGDVPSKRDRLAELVRVANGAVVYVGDTEYDIEAAFYAGAIPIAVTGGYRPVSALRAAGPAFLCPDLTVVAQHIRSRFDGHDE